MNATETKTIHIYNENCVMAGHAVPQKRLDESPDSWDWSEYDLTEENAVFWEARGRHGARIAETIRENM